MAREKCAVEADENAEQKTILDAMRTSRQYVLPAEHKAPLDAKAREKRAGKRTAAKKKEKDAVAAAAKATSKEKKRKTHNSKESRLGKNTKKAKISAPESKQSSMVQICSLLTRSGWKH